MVATDDLALIEQSLTRFGEHATDTLFGPGHDRGPDGDLDAVPSLLGELAAMDLVADPAPAGVGHDVGVWGRHVLGDGCRISFVALASLAESCAGLASAVHAQGIGCLALDGWFGTVAGVSPGQRVATAAVFVPRYGVAFDERTLRDGVRYVAESATAPPCVHGASPFVWALERPDWLVVVAPVDSAGVEGDAGARRAARREWAVVTVPADSSGVHIADVGARVGVRALRQYEVTFDGVPVPDGAVVAIGGRAARIATRVVACDWLGQSAMAFGSSRRALSDARTYTEGRYQGGQMISGHAAVQLLLAEADHDVAVMNAVLATHADEPLDTIRDDVLLRWAIACRLAVGEHAHRAVTNCVQALGGYGYMDDFGLSKRLRDVSALRSRHGSREQLLLLLDGLIENGAV